MPQVKRPADESATSGSNDTQFVLRIPKLPDDAVLNEKDEPVVLAKLRVNSSRLDGIIPTSERPEEDHKIPPADGGTQAWLFLAGCFMFEALVWGFAFSFGVFQSYYTDHTPFSTQPDGIAAVGTCSTGVMYLFAPVSLYFLDSFPGLRRMCSVIGLVVMIVALLSASFATRVWQLIATQGVLYAIGGSLMYSPTMFYLDEWFIRRKGFAFGVMWSGAGTSGLIFPFLLSSLLEKLGYATTLRIYALVLLSLCAPLIYYVKPRLPALPIKPAKRSQSSSKLSKLSTTLREISSGPLHLLVPRDRTLPILQTLNVLTSLGFFLPAIYLPLYATRTLSLGSTRSVLLLAILNCFSVFGAVSMGWLCDHLHVKSVILISAVGSTCSAVLLWGFAGNLGALVAFAAGWGLFAGGFSAIWTGMIKHVQNEYINTSACLSLSKAEASCPTCKKSAPKMGNLMGLFSAGRGIGAVCSGPISEALLRSMHGRGLGGGDAKGHGYASQYGVLIVFTGVTAAMGLLALALRGNPRPRTRQGHERDSSKVNGDLTHDGHGELSR